MGEAMTTQGTKLDTGKLPLDLLPFAALEEVAKVLAFGAKKYAPNNWRKGLAHSRTLGAALRHVFAYLRGEDRDPETGFSHLAHAACDVLFALTYECEGRSDLDDRYTPEPPTELQRRACMGPKIDHTNPRTAA